MPRKKAYRIADNKLTENDQWDIDLLNLEITELSNIDLSFPLEVTGFSTTEIDLIIAGEENNEPEVFDLAK